MVAVRLRATDKPLLIGRIDGGDELQKAGSSTSLPFSPPAAVRIGKDNAAVARNTTDPESLERSGRKIDVKPNLHWVLVPNDSDGYDLLSVPAWYEFAQKALPPSKDGGKAQRREREEQSVNEVQKESDLRSQFSQQWNAIKQRRLERVGTGPIKIGSAMKEETEKRKLPEEKYSEKAHLEDETGMKRQQKKRKKQQKKLAGGHAEDEDAPTTANAMHTLKSERGEDGWDFDDENNFSDDEQDKFEFDDQLETVNNEEAPPTPDGTPPEIDDGDDADALLGGHGQEIEVLLKGGLEVADGADEQEELEDADDDDQEIEESAPPSASPPPEQSPTPLHSRSPKHAASGSSGAATGRKSLQNESSAGIQRRAVECLLMYNGVCSAQAACTALGVDSRDKSKPYYRTVLEALRQVAEVKNVPGHERRMLVLRPEYMKSTK